MFVDVTLACGGKLYSSHKFVLSTCSEYFKEIFSKNPCNHPVVFLKDVSGKDLEALLDFMYKGEVNVPQTDLGSLIKTAESLQVKGLAVPDETQQYIRRNERTSFRDTHTPRPPPQPEPSSSPPPKRKRNRDLDSYTPVGALNVMYSNISPQHHNLHHNPHHTQHPHHQEPNSPYDLSQKSSSSSISQSDNINNERTHSISPDHPLHSQATSSSYHSGHHPHHLHDGKESSPDEMRSPPSNAHTPQPSRTPQPPHTPQSSSSTPCPSGPSTTPLSTPSTEMNCIDKGDSDPLPGPSGLKGKPIKEEAEESVSFLCLLYFYILQSYN